MKFLKQSTASQSVIIGPFVDDTDFKSAETGLSIANTDIKLMKNGAASVNKNSGGGTHRVNGEYSITLDATDTNTVGELTVSVVVSGALPVRTTFRVLEEAIYDALFGASSTGKLPATLATADVTGNLPANVIQAAGTAWGSGAITAASVATGAITSAKFAASAINAAAIATDAISATKIASGAITSAKFASGAITSTVLATDCITSDEIAASAVSEIQAGLATPTNITAGTITTVTTLTNLPSIPTDWLTAAGIDDGALDGKGDWNTETPPTVGATADGVWNALQSTHTTVGSFGEMATEIAAILADTGELQTNQGDWATATGFSTHSAADVNTAVEGGQIGTDTAAILVDTGTTIPATLDSMAGATFNTSTDSLEAIRNRGDAEWTTGAGGSSPTVEEIRAEMDSNSTQLAAIVADTNEMQTDLANGGRLDLIFDATLADTNELQTNQGNWLTATGFATAAALTTVDGNVDLILEDTGTTLPATLSAIAGYLDTEIAAILADTDELQTNQGNWITATGFSTHSAADVRTEMDSNSTQLAAIVADTNELQTDDVPGLIGALNNISTAQVNAEVDTALSDYDPPTKAELDAAESNIRGADSDTIKTISDQVDGLATAAAPQLLVNTTIATLASQTSFTLTSGSADDGAYDGAIAVITDQSTATQKAVGSVSSYTGSSKTITLSGDPGVFTMAVGDTIDILAAIGSAPTVTQIRTEIDNNSTQLAAIVADTGELQTNQGNWLTATGFATAAALTTVDSNVDAIKVKTDQMVFTVANQLDANALTGGGGDDAATIYTYFIASNREDAFKADVSSLATAAALTTVDGNVDSILEDTGTTIPATLSTIAGYLDTEIAAIKSVTDQMVFTVANQLDANALTGGGGSSASDIADAVWTEAIADHSGVSGSTAEALAAAGSAGDPWITPLPGAYAAGTAGYIVGNSDDVGPSPQIAKAYALTTRIVTGDDAAIPVQLELDDATFVIDPGATVRAALTDGCNAVSAVVTCSSTATDADWSTSLVVVEFDKSQTLNLKPDKGLTMEIEVIDGTKRTYHASYFEIVRGVI